MAGPSYTDLQLTRDAQMGFPNQTSTGTLDIKKRKERENEVRGNGDDIAELLSKS